MLDYTKKQAMKLFKHFSHVGNLGDTLSALPSLRQYYRKTGIKPILYLVKDHPAKYYEGATHPTVDQNGAYVGLNKKGCEMIKPLIEAQDYIDEVRIIDTDQFKDSDIHVNLSDIRDKYVGMPSFDIRRWYFYIFPDLACNLFDPYIHVQDSKHDISKGKIIISRSERYQNEIIDYSFLKSKEDKILFCGTDNEYKLFSTKYNLNIGRLIVNDFYFYAQALKQCKFHLSNQTMAFQISQGLQIPRIVELCPYAPNVIPTGEYAYDFFQTWAAEYYVNELDKLFD